MNTESNNEADFEHEQKQDHSEDDFLLMHQLIGGPPRSMNQVLLEHQPIGGRLLSEEEIILSHTPIGLKN